MGQYWEAVVNNVAYSTFGGGAKIMEHSCLKNNYVCGVVGLIAHNPQEVLWVGDYCSEILDQIEDETLRKKIETAIAAPDSLVINEELNAKYTRICKKKHNRTYFEELKNLEVEQFGTSVAPDMSKGYLVNHSKGEVLDLAAYVKRSTDKDGWCVNPLPLLTAVPYGNGLGGGDYYATNPYLAYWCGDVISYEIRLDTTMKGYSNLPNVTFVDK